MNAIEFKFNNLVKYAIGDHYIDRSPYLGKDIYSIKVIMDDSIKIDMGFNALQRVLFNDPKLFLIPLTEEWLLKFGFVKSPANNSIYKSIPEIKAEVHFEKFRGDLVCVTYCSTGSLIPTDVKFVHQLQNLYYALCGQELALV